MSLILCKECREKISSQLDSCLHCGVLEPWKSFDEERIEREIASYREEESCQENLYREAMKRTFMWWGHKTVRHHVALANIAQAKATELESKRQEARDAWRKKNYL